MRVMASICFLFLLVPVVQAKGKQVPEAILSAKSVCVVARVGVSGNSKMRPNADRAKAQVEQALKKWGRYEVVNEESKADLVLVVNESNSATYSDGTMDRTAVFAGNNMDVLADSLAVYKAGGITEQSKPLWIRTEMNEDNGWPTERLVNHLRKDVEKSSK
jgi:hypothetical protein